MFIIKPKSPADKNMANGSRCLERTPLTQEQINLVLKEAYRIQMDDSILIFNDRDHIEENNTCYNYEKDKIFIAKNVLPDDRFGSTHPRDLMSIGAILAHEYYGHRQFREEYLSDLKKGHGYQTTPLWQDECRASITAAKTAPGLTNRDRAHLLLDAIKRAEEAGHYIEMDDYMKGVIYGNYSTPEKSIVPRNVRIRYVSIKSQDRADKNRYGKNNMSKMSSKNTGYSR